MRVVLLTDGMEPITIIDLTPGALRLLERDGVFRVHIFGPSGVVGAGSAGAPVQKFVEISGQRFVRNGREHWFLFTGDAEAAAMLQSDLVSGRYVHDENRPRRDYVDGFLLGLQRL